MAKNHTDKIVVIKIAKYVRQLREAHIIIKDIPADKLEDELYAYSVAQLITNLKSAYEMLKCEELQERYKLLRQPAIVRIRNIAAHDYEALNWSIVKNGCKKIVDAYTDSYNEESAKLIGSKQISLLEEELLDKLSHNIQDT
jgi:hypothetical protein